MRTGDRGFLAFSSFPPRPSPFARVVLSRSIARDVLHALPQLGVSFSRPDSRRARRSLRRYPASCVTVNHSACDCVRLITVIRRFLVPVYRLLIIIIDFSLVRHFLVFVLASYRTAPRMYDQTDPRRPAPPRPRESLSFGSLHP